MGVGSNPTHRSGRHSRHRVHSCFHRFENMRLPADQTAGSRAGPRCHILTTPSPGRHGRWELGKPMDRSDYEIVLAVAGLGSIPAAAHALGLDVQAARRRLDGLESRQGVALFSHGPQGSTPTPVGLRLAMLARATGMPVETGGVASWPATAALAGCVRVMADTAMTAALLQPAISAL